MRNKVTVINVQARDGGGDGNGISDKCISVYTVLFFVNDGASQTDTTCVRLYQRRGRNKKRWGDLAAFIICWAGLIGQR